MIKLFALQTALSRALFCLTGLTLLVSCGDKGALAYEKNTPTSGNLTVYVDEGLAAHIHNQAYTFSGLYPRANVQVKSSTESEAIQALYNDSCEAIVISRLLNSEEVKAFQSKKYSPKFSEVAYTGLAFITNTATNIRCMNLADVKELLTKPGANASDSSGKPITLQVVFAGYNSSSLHYVIDSVVKHAKLSANCSILQSSAQTINYVKQHPNTVGVINYAWLSDVDDSLYKANSQSIKTIALNKQNDSIYYLPDPSNFKLNLYPFMQRVYVIRKQGDFTLAKGFESFVMGPKGQLTFLKQGLLPARQAERNIEVKTQE